MGTIPFTPTLMTGVSSLMTGVPPAPLDTSFNVASLVCFRSLTLSPAERMRKGVVQSVPRPLHVARWLCASVRSHHGWLLPLLLLLLFVRLLKENVVV